MSRLPSIDIPNALYYVQLQSNGHCQLLSSRQEFAELRDQFAPLTQHTGARLLGYCLFQDSLHLVVRAGDSGINAVSEWLVTTHTEAFNSYHQRHGSLYSQHSLNVLIEPQHYLLPVIHKLHWLPVRAGLVSTPQAYPWCSHRDYLAPECPPWLDRQDILVKVANHRASQLRRYQYFIEDSRQASIDWVEGVNKQYRALASDSYIRTLLSRHETHHEPQHEVHHETREGAHQLLPVLDLDALTEWICGEYQLEEKDLVLWRRHRLGGEVQAVIGALAKVFKVATTTEVASYFGCDEDVLVSGIRALEARRGMFLFKLQLRLDQWLINHFRDDNAQVSNLEPQQPEHKVSDDSDEPLATEYFVENSNHHSSVTTNYANTVRSQ